MTVTRVLFKTLGHEIVSFDAERVEDGPAVRPYRLKRVTAIFDCEKIGLAKDEVLRVRETEFAKHVFGLRDVGPPAGAGSWVAPSSKNLMRFVSRNPFPLMVGLCCCAALISEPRPSSVAEPLRRADGNAAPPVG